VLEVFLLVGKVRFCHLSGFFVGMHWGRSIKDSYWIVPVTLSFIISDNDTGTKQ
jgi:hypothetical protein